METVQTQTLPTPPPIPVDPDAWLRILCSQIGVDPTEVPSGVVESIKQKRSKNSINQVFMDWYTAKPPIVDCDLSLDDLAILKEATSARQSQLFLRAKQDLDYNLKEALNYQHQVGTRLKACADIREKMFQLDATMRKDMSLEVQKAMAQGWWKYNSQATQHWSKIHGTTTICFTSPDVHMRHYNREAKIDQTVLMGKYLIKIRPSTNEVNLCEFDNNVKVIGYIHPHASSSGFCWGTAASTVAQALDKLELLPVLNAAQTILENYNSESPFVAANEFAYARGIKDGSIVPEYKAHAKAEIIWEERPRGITEYERNYGEHITEDDDGEEITHETASLQIYTNADGEFYYRNSANEYVAYDDDSYHHVGWL